MRMLFLTSRLPYPPHRGDRLKVYQLLRHFSRKHALTLVTLIESHDELRYIDKLQPYCAKIYPVLHRPSVGYLKCLLHLPSQRPFQLAYFDSDKIRHVVKKVMASQRFDVVYAHLIRMADYVRDLPDVRKILAMEDPFSLHYRRSLAYRKGLSRLLCAMEGSRTLKYEKDISRHFDHCLVVSSSDKELLEWQLKISNLASSPHGVDLEYFSWPNRSEEGSPTILFSGNMGYYPNIDGALYFRREILPLIWRSIPEARFIIVGTNPPSAVRRLAGDPRVTVTGFVKDIRPYFRSATVAVCPLRIGAGIQNKILEALAMGVPVVATPLANSAVRLIPEVEALLSNDAADFARQTTRALVTPELRHWLSKNGRKAVEERYDWETNLGILESLICSPPSAPSASPKEGNPEDGGQNPEVRPAQSAGRGWRGFSF